MPKMTKFQEAMQYLTLAKHYAEDSMDQEDRANREAWMDLAADYAKQAAEILRNIQF